MAVGGSGKVAGRQPAAAPSASGSAQAAPPAAMSLPALGDLGLPDLIATRDRLEARFSGGGGGGGGRTAQDRLLGELAPSQQGRRPPKARDRLARDLFVQARAGGGAGLLDGPLQFQEVAGPPAEAPSSRHL